MWCIYRGLPTLLILLTLGCGGRAERSRSESGSVDTADQAEATDQETTDQETTDQETTATDAGEAIVADASSALIRGQKFRVPGYFSIGIPDGYSWSANEATVRGVPGVLAVCQPNEGGTDVVMTVGCTQKELLTSDVRRTAIKGHINGMGKSMRDSGFTGLSRAGVPGMSGEIGERFEYSLDCIRPNGEPVLLRGVSLFGKHTTVVFMLADTEDELRVFEAALATLVEEQ